jgi:diacylglycerol kinase family enzyme
MHLLIGNPTAQSGKNRQRIEAARALLLRHGLKHDFLATLPGGKTAGAVAEALQKQSYHAVIAMGGDGTFKEVATGLIQSGLTAKTALAMLPTGTANDQGRSFGLSASPSALEQNVQVIKTGYTTPFDAGKILAYDHLDKLLLEDYFFDSAGWGFSPWVLKLRNFDRQLVSEVPFLSSLYRDQLVYAGAALRAFAATYVEEHRFEAAIELDGRSFVLSNLTDLVVKNTRYYGGAWVFDPTASPEDGLMELVPLGNRAEWISRLILNFDPIPLKDAFLDAMLGELPFANQIPAPIKLAPIERGSRFSIRLHDRPGSPGIDSQLDGEEWVGGARFDITVARHALNLTIPHPG